MVTVELTEEETQVVRDQNTEGGGFQSLFGKLQAGLDGKQLTIDEQTARTVVRYLEYRPGGWEDRLDPIAEKIQAEL